MARPKRIRPEEIGSQSKFIRIAKDFLDKEGGTKKDLEAALKRENVETQSKFILIVEQYLAKAGWTKSQFMAEMQVGESQFYRWARGENIPTKAIVNRTAVTLASRFDTIDRELPHNPFPMSDKIDGLLNELLVAAGYSASVKGKAVDSCWQEIIRDGSWTIGYTNVDPKWAKFEKPNVEPTGSAIRCAKRVAGFLGINTEWKYLTWEQMSNAISERQVHGIAPFMLAAPGRLFNHRFSDPWYGEGTFSLSGVTLPKFNTNSFLEDLPLGRVELVYIKNEIGNYIADVLTNVYGEYKLKPFEDRIKAINYLKEFDSNNSKLVPILCSDNRSCDGIADDEGWSIVKIRYFQKLELHPAFAFHLEEEKLTNAVNSVLKMVNDIAEDKGK